MDYKKWKGTEEIERKIEGSVVDVSVSEEQVGSGSNPVSLIFKIDISGENKSIYCELQDIELLKELKVGLNAILNCNEMRRRKGL